MIPITIMPTGKAQLTVIIIILTTIIFMVKKLKVKVKAE